MSQIHPHRKTYRHPLGFDLLFERGRLAWRRGEEIGEIVDDRIYVPWRVLADGDDLVAVTRDRMVRLVFVGAPLTFRLLDIAAD